MTTEKLINQRIEELEQELEKIILEVERLTEKINIINETIEVLNECDESMINFNIDKSLDILVENGIDINEDKKAYINVKNIIEYYFSNNIKEYSIFEEYKKEIDKLKLELLSVKSLLEEKLSINIDNTSYQKDINSLKEVLLILTSNDNEKYIDNEMLLLLNKYLFSYYSVDELVPLYNDLFKSYTLSTKDDKENKKTIEDVINLLKKYIKEEMYIKYIKDNKQSILERIDISNSEKILNFFEENDLIKYFECEKITLINIIIYGKLDKIKEVYEKINKLISEGIDPYTFFASNMLSIWINDKSKEIKRIRSENLNRSRFNRRKESNLSSYSNTIENLMENVSIIKENSDLFDEKSDNDIYNSSIIKAITPKLLRKNIKLCRIYGLGKSSKLAFSILNGDLERRINFAIELGLLKSPINSEFEEYSQYIPYKYEYEHPSGRILMHDESIRNYFSNYTSMLMEMTDLEFAYLSKKLSDIGLTLFYKTFFSEYRGTAGSKKGYSTEEVKNIKESYKIKFASGEEEIVGYSEYCNAINKNSDMDFGDNYYDLNILNDNLIGNLEDENAIFDEIPHELSYKIIRNEFVYKFDNRKDGGNSIKLISRCKVLRNASILRSIYGYLNEDMILTSILKDSLITDNDFIVIKSQIKGKEL